MHTQNMSGATITNTKRARGLPNKASKEQVAALVNHHRNREEEGPLRKGGDFPLANRSHALHSPILR